MQIILGPKLSLSHFQVESSQALTEINWGTLVKDLQNSQLREAKDEQKFWLLPDLTSQHDVGRWLQTLGVEDGRTDLK
jgi:hypothetical protein